MKAKEYPGGKPMELPKKYRDRDGGIWTIDLRKGIVCNYPDGRAGCTWAPFAPGWVPNYPTARVMMFMHARDEDMDIIQEGEE